MVLRTAGSRQLQPHIQPVHRGILRRSIVAVASPEADNQAEATMPRREPRVCPRLLPDPFASIASSGTRSRL